jgi:hypothetical protein
LTLGVDGEGSDYNTAPTQQSLNVQRPTCIALSPAKEIPLNTLSQLLSTTCAMLAPLCIHHYDDFPTTKYMVEIGDRIGGESGLAEMAWALGGPEGNLGKMLFRHVHFMLTVHGSR